MATKARRQRKARWTRGFATRAVGCATDARTHSKHLSFPGSSMISTISTGPRLSFACAPSLTASTLLEASRKSPRPSPCLSPPDSGTGALPLTDLAGGAGCESLASTVSRACETERQGAHSSVVADGPPLEKASHAPRTEMPRAPAASAHEPPPPLQLQPASPAAPQLQPAISQLQPASPPSQSVVAMPVLLRRLLQQEYTLPG
eukprot:scaffold13333_cov66-Phaeocystis_antarctica.AAC.1